MAISEYLPHMVKWCMEVLVFLFDPFWISVPSAYSNIYVLPQMRCVGVLSYGAPAQALGCEVGHHCRYTMESPGRDSDPLQGGCALQAVPCWPVEEVQGAEWDQLASQPSVGLADLPGSSLNMDSCCAASVVSWGPSVLNCLQLIASVYSPAWLGCKTAFFKKKKNLKLHRQTWGALNSFLDELILISSGFWRD